MSILHSLFHSAAGYNLHLAASYVQAEGSNRKDSENSIKDLWMQNWIQLNQIQDVELANEFNLKLQTGNRNCHYIVEGERFSVRNRSMDNQNTWPSSMVVFGTPAPCIGCFVRYVH